MASSLLSSKLRREPMASGCFPSLATENHLLLYSLRHSCLFFLRMASGWPIARRSPASKRCTSCLSPGPGGKWQVSPGGGCYPRWRRDGKELFYLSTDNRIMAAEVNTGGSSFGIGATKPL